jgi:hypothetical protein
MVRPMESRSAHYTALVETVDRGATKLRAEQRAEVLGAADALLFNETDSERLVRGAEAVIESLEVNDRWSAECCDQLREHLYGCGVGDDNVGSC